MTTEQKRSELMKAYPSHSWKQKCKKMPENQVIALYLKFKKEGKI